MVISGQALASTRLRRLMVTVLLLGAPTLAFAQQGTAECEQALSSAPDYNTAFHQLGLPWPVLNDLLQQAWTPADRGRRGWSDYAAMIAAAERAPLDTLYTVLEAGMRTNYLPRFPATAAQTATYEAAAARYGEGQFREAIAQFDAIAAEPQSPFAAAAAYSAARATLEIGYFDDGIRRTGQIVADPQWQDMHQAAKHLIGTVAYRTGASPLIAAHLTNITHLLAAPADLQCRYSDLRALVLEAEEDLRWLLAFAYPTNRWTDYEPWSGHTRSVMARVGVDNPVVDLARVLAAPSPFKLNGPWTEPFYPELVPNRGVRVDDQPVTSQSAADGPALTAHAREKAVSTGNPLWAFALAIRTRDIGDIDILKSAEGKVAIASIGRDQRGLLTDRLIAQQARILLMAGYPDEALQAAKRLGGFSGAFDRDTPRNLAVDGGTSFLLAKRDLAGARQWHMALDKGYRPSWDRPFQVVLAQTWEEALAGKPPIFDEHRLSTAGLDLLPATRLVALSRNPAIPFPVRRSMLLAAWTRFYMQRDDKAFRGLYPDILANFPEVAADLDDSERAWLPSTRRHRMTRLLLRLPGLSPRPSWTGEAGKLATIRSGDPSDANWWCPADPKRSERDFFTGLYQPISSVWFSTPNNPGYSRDIGDTAADHARQDAIAHEWIAQHPLFKDADLNELQRLSEVESGPVRLGQEAIAWANGSNQLTRLLGFDQGLPETLALAVRATRWGCRRTGPIDVVSHGAWKALHELYPDSIAAARTPYWFDMRLERPTAP